MHFERHEDPQFADIWGGLFISPSILSLLVFRFYSTASLSPHQPPPLRTELQWLLRYTVGVDQIILVSCLQKG